MFPEIKKPDAGMVIGILGLQEMDTIKFCPECLSAQINTVKTEAFCNRSQVKEDIRMEEKI